MPVLRVPYCCTNDSAACLHALPHHAEEQAPDMGWQAAAHPTRPLLVRTGLCLFYVYAYAGVFCHFGPLKSARCRGCDSKALTTRHTMCHCTNQLVSIGAVQGPNDCAHLHQLQPGVDHRVVLTRLHSISTCDG